MTADLNEMIVGAADEAVGGWKTARDEQEADRLRFTPGGNGDHAEDGAEDDEPMSAADYLRSRLMTTEQIRKLPPPAPLIDGLLHLDSLALLFGGSGIGKSHLAVDFANHVTCRPTWQGHNVTNGDALYIVAEGVSGMGMRADAWDLHHHTTAAVTWLPEAVNIYSPRWASALAEVVADVRPSLVVVDTFARSIVGADENSARDIGQAVAHLDMIRRAAGSCVLVVHHSGKDRAAGARGSSALRGALDTELELTGGDGRLTLRNPKQKNSAEHPPVNLTLVGSGASVVVVAAGPESVDDLPGAVFATLESLREIDVPGGVSTAAWRVAADASERTFYRHRSGLVQHGLVTNVGTDKQARYRPTEALEGSDDD